MSQKEKWSEIRVEIDALYPNGWEPAENWPITAHHAFNWMVMSADKIDEDEASGLIAIRFRRV